HTKANRKLVWIEVRICGDGLRYRSKGVEPFRSGPWGTFLPGLRLQVPRCDVEEHGISSDVVHRGGARNVAASLIQDDRELVLDTTSKKTQNTKLTRLPKSPYIFTYNTPRTATRLKTACMITAVR